MKGGDTLDLRIEKAVYGGDGLARYEGRAVFVPFALAGEHVTATVTDVKPGFARAALQSIQQPSPDRTTPPCPYYGTCGGCHYQHANYPAQVAIKSAVLLETLTRAQLGPLPDIIPHTADPLGYRNRIRLHIDPGSSELGYRQRASHRLLAVDQCPIAAPALQQALRALSPLCAVHRIGRFFSEIELAVNHDGSELLLSFTLRPAPAFAPVSAPTSGQAPAPDARAAAAALPVLSAALAAQLPTLRGAGIFAPAPPPNRKRGPSDKDARVDVAAGEPGALLTSWGSPRMTYRAAGQQYQVSLGAFFQINRLLTDQLVSIATNSRQGALAWDLYAGAGLFSRVLAQHFTQVIAVEGAPISAADLRANLPTPHRAVQSGTAEFLRQQVPTSRKPAKNTSATPDFVLLDPPRAGLGAEITTLLAQIGPPAITYVSCDPATLARDLRALIASGYHIEQLHLVDLFPQTFHLETVVMLARD